MWLSAALLLLLQTATDPVEDGRKALDANQFDRAAELFSQAVARDPADYAAHFHLALTYSLKNDDGRAIPEYQKTLQLKPGLYQAQLNLGISLLRAGRGAEAVPLLEAAVAQKPEAVQPRVNLGAAYFAGHRFAEAEAAYTAAAGVQSSAEIELGLGKAIASQNRLDAAAPHFRAAATKDPKYRDALLILAELYEQAKQADPAMEIYRAFPENLAAQERLGELLLEAKRFAEAIPKLEQAVAGSPTAANRLALATAYRMNQQPDQAREALAKAVAASSRDYDLRMVYGRTLRDERKFAEAGQQFYAAAQMRPDGVEAWNEMAAALLLAEDYAHGLAALDQVRRLGKETSGNQFLRAITLDRLKQLKPALESYEQFLASDGGKNPDQEFQARQRARIIRLELSKK